MNSWDDFPDAPAAAATDPWAAFPDAPPAKAAVITPAQAASVAKDNPLAKPTPRSPLTDIIMSLGSGVVKGASELPQIPATVERMANAGFKKVFDTAESGIRYAVGAPQVSKETQAQRAAAESQAGLLNSGQDAVRSGIDSVLHTPQTVGGEYARTIGEFAPSVALGPAGVGRSLTGRIVGDALVPAIMSETAGQLTKGTAAEPYARFAGGVAGNVGSAVVASRASAPERMVQRSTAGMTPQQWDDAAAMQASGRNVGVPLTGPESVQQVTDNGTKLADVMRIVEGSTTGGAVTTPFFAQRPGQVQTAVGNALDAVAPASAAPSTLGPRAAEAATGAIDDVRNGINAATRPLYSAAERQTVDMDNLIDAATGRPTPAFAASLQRVRNHPILGPTLREEPNNSVAVLDAVRKDMHAQGTVATTAGEGFQPQVGGILQRDAVDLGNTMRTQVPEFDLAQTAQEQARRQNLNPLEQGPVGRIAAAGDTQTAYGEILPTKPLVGGEREIADAVTRLQAQDPGLPGQLIRQSLGDTFDQAARRLQNGPNQYAGANFAKAAAGTPQQQTNLNTAIGATMVPGANERVNELLDVLRATGTRKQPGSPTAFIQQGQNELAAPGVAGLVAAGVKTGGLAYLPIAKEALQRAWLGRGNNTLAQLFTSPDSVQQLRAIAEQVARHPGGEALVRQIMQTGAETRAR